MARGKPRSKPETHSSSFADAIKFATLILKDHGSINETHVCVQNNLVTAFNGVLAIGHKCDNDIVAYPQAKLTAEALSKCGQTVAISTNQARLSIRSGSFRAYVPCIETGLIEPQIPDLPVATIDDKLKEALIAAGGLSNENDQQIYNVSVLLSGGSVISSMGGSLLYQHWHGIDLPPLLVLPTAFCAVLGKINKKLTRFGYSNHSVTFYFEDDSWIRSQCCAEPWPDVSRVFDCKADLQPFPVDFWKALAAVAPFSEGMVWLRNGRLASHAQEGAGAEFELAGMQGGWTYPAKHLAFLQPWANVVDFQAQGANGPCLSAMGRNARAIIAGVKNSS